MSQSQESQKWQPSATRLTQAIRTSDATASQGSSSSQSPPMQFSYLSSAGGSSRVSGPFVSAHGGSTSYGGSFQSQSLSTKYTPGSQHLPYDAGVAGQGTSSASEVLSSYSSMNNQNAPAQPSLLGQGLKDSGKLMQMSSRIETPINILSKAVFMVSLLPPNTIKDGGILAGFSY